MAHQNIYLDETGEYSVNASCYLVQKMMKKPWFILPPSQAWYYKKYNLDYIDPPEFKKECIVISNQMIEMIYPTNFTRVFVPMEIDGKPGKVVFEAAHRQPGAKIFWYLDDFFLGETTFKHQMGLFPDAGKHRLSLVDDQGTELSTDFEAINDRKR